MKHIHHLKASWLIGMMIVAVAIGEAIAIPLCKALDIRCPVIAVAAICVGLVAAGVSLMYDGHD